MAACDEDQEVATVHWTMRVIVLPPKWSFWQRQGAVVELA
jgi:hypothetical protein